MGNILQCFGKKLLLMHLYCCEKHAELSPGTQLANCPMSTFSTLVLWCSVTENTPVLPEHPLPYKSVLFTHQKKPHPKSRMQQASHHAILPWGWDRREWAACDRCHIKHHLQMVMLCSVQDTCIMHLHKLNWGLPYPHTYRHILAGLLKSKRVS